MFFGLKENKALKERPEDEAKPSLKNPVDRKIFYIIGGVGLVVLIILIVVIVLVVNVYL
ncbi:MAG: hypothetical protein ACOX28_04195 [Bacilli bacterium]|jgi:hypothetical protein